MLELLPASCLSTVDLIKVNTLNFSFWNLFFLIIYAFLLFLFFYCLNLYLIVEFPRVLIRHSNSYSSLNNATKIILTNEIPDSFSDSKQVDYCPRCRANTSMVFKKPGGPNRLSMDLNRTFTGNCNSVNKSTNKWYEVKYFFKIPMVFIS